jgi:hypothetical protein
MGNKTEPYKNLCVVCREECQCVDYPYRNPDTGYKGIHYRCPNGHTNKKRIFKYKDKDEVVR